MLDYNYFIKYILLQEAVAHLSRLGVVGADMGSLVDTDSGEAGESSVSSVSAEESSPTAQDFSEIDEVNFIYSKSRGKKRELAKNFSSWLK